MTNQPNILMIVTDQEYAHQPMPAEFALPARDVYPRPRGHFQ